MRIPLLCVLAATIVMLASPSAVSAHGGVYRGPGGVVPPGIRGADDPAPPPPPPLCHCAAHGCPDCTTSTQRARADLALARREVREVGRIGDLRELAVTLRLRAKGGTGAKEAVLPCELGSLCWVTSASIAKGESRLTAAKTDRQSAIERYRETLRRLVDPLVVLRSGPGTLDIRAWPVVANEDTVVTLRAYALEDRPSSATQIYRHGKHGLVVIPKAAFEGLALDELDTKGWTIHVDRRNGRAFVFLPWVEGARDRHALFPTAPVHRVRQLADLKRFFEGKGESALVAVEPLPNNTPPTAPPAPRTPQLETAAEPAAEVVATR